MNSSTKNAKRTRPYSLFKKEDRCVNKHLNETLFNREFDKNSFRNIKVFLDGKENKRFKFKNSNLKVVNKLPQKFSSFKSGKFEFKLNLKKLNNFRYDL